MTTVTTELVVIESEKALAILSTNDGVDRLVEEVRVKVMSLDGGSMKNKTSRKQIRSNAFKATKAKTKINDDHIQPLIEGITRKIQPDLDTIQAIKDNKKRLDAGLDQVRKDVNQEVDEFEAELQRVEDEKAEAARRAEIKMQIELLWDYAHIRLNEFKLAELMIIDYLDEKQRLHEEKIAFEAAEKARIKAEQDAEAKILAEREAAEKSRIEAEARAKAEIEAAQAAEAKAKQDAIDTENKRVADLKAAAEETERQRQAAIQAEIESEEAEERRIAQVAESKRLADIAEEQRVEREKQLAIEAEQRKKQSIIDSLEREKRRELARIEADKQAKIKAEQAAERARIDEVARHQAEIKRLSDEANARQANKNHIGGIRKAQKEFLMSKGASEEVAKAIVMGMAKGEMPHVKVIY